MTIITHLKITFIIIFLGGLIFWNLLNISCKCEGVSTFEAEPEPFFADIG